MSDQEEELEAEVLELTAKIENYQRAWTAVTEKHDKELAEAHRRGAIEALNEAIGLLETDTPRGILVVRVLEGLRARYEKEETCDT